MSKYQVTFHIMSYIRNEDVSVIEQPISNIQNAFKPLELSEVGRLPLYDKTVIQPNHLFEILIKHKRGEVLLNLPSSFFEWVDYLVKTNYFFYMQEIFIVPLSSVDYLVTIVLPDFYSGKVDYPFISQKT